MLRRLAILAVLALPVPVLAEEAPAPAPAPAPEPAPAPAPEPEVAPPAKPGLDPLKVPTHTVPNDLVPSPGGPAASGRTGVFVQQPSLAVDLVGTTEADGTRTWTGVLEAGARKIALRLRSGAENALTLESDQDGDGKVDSAKESVTAKPRPWTMAKATLGTEWAFDGVKVAGSPILFGVYAREFAFGAQVILPGREGARPGGVGLALADQAPASVKAAPSLAGKVRYGTATVQAKDVVVAIARGEGDALSLVWAEAASGDLAAATPVPMTPTPLLRGKKRLGTRWQSAPLAYGGGTVVFQVSETLESVQAMANAPATRRGTIDLDDRPFATYLMDGDLDGQFTGPDDWWWLGLVEKDLRPSTNNMTEGNEPRYLGTNAWRLTGLDKDGAAVFARAKDAPPFEDYLRRRTERVNAKRWFPRFEEDKEFATSRKLDPSRPRAEKPPAFHFARTLREARAMAATEGKPLLVDFEADWCVWCKRLDYYTYPDREVADLIGKFTAVKINNDLDPDRSFKLMKSASGEPWTGIPAIAFFDHEGKLLLFRMPGPDGKPGRVTDHVPGWNKPDVFAATLRAALEQYEALKAGAAPLQPEPLPSRGHHGDGPRPSKPADDDHPTPPAPPPPPPAPAPEQPK